MTILRLSEERWIMKDGKNGLDLPENGSNGYLEGKEREKKKKN
jgi:hypothetical protein